jgi:hypothetical protein
MACDGGDNRAAPGREKKHCAELPERSIRKSLKLLDPETGNEPEVPEIDRQDGEPKLQSRYADKKVAKWDGNPRACCSPSILAASKAVALV